MGFFYFQILWISDDGVPDLGGIHDGETCFADEVQPYKPCFIWQMFRYCFPVFVGVTCT